MSKLLLILSLTLVLTACGTSSNNSKDPNSAIGFLNFVADKSEHFDCIVGLTFQQPKDLHVEVLNTKILFGFGKGQRLGGRTLDLTPGKVEQFEFSQTFSCEKLNIEAIINHCRIDGKNLQCPEINITGDQYFKKITLQTSL